MTSARERWSYILEVLSRDGYTDIDSTAASLNVSTATIRRDLDRLAEQQMLTRTRGGAVSNSTAYDLPLRYNAQRNVQQKAAIAEVAARRIPAGAVVAVTGGTTTTEVARALAVKASIAPSKSESTLTVVTNAINIANELTVRPHIRLVVLGGLVRPQSYELTGRLADLTLEEISIDVAVIGGNALDARTGLSCHNEAEAAVARAVSRNALQTIAVVDSSKLGKQAFARVCDASQLSVVITDHDADPLVVAELEERGVEVVLA